ncbi:hypothetical protein, partial [Acinetobacter baumannii]
MPRGLQSSERLLYFCQMGFGLRFSPRRDLLDGGRGLYRVSGLHCKEKFLFLWWKLARLGYVSPNSLQDFLGKILWGGLGGRSLTLVVSAV